METTEILEKLERFGISSTEHSQTTLLAHLKGTQNILVEWDCPRYISLAGLCHSIYGTESFSKSPATLENREYIKRLIGEDAEQLTYLFGAHKKESLWQNLDRNDSFSIEDRFTDKTLVLSGQNVRDLITVTLANWLEQRSRVAASHQFLRQGEFMRSERLLPPKGFQAFLTAYGLKK